MGSTLLTVACKSKLRNHPHVYGEHYAEKGLSVLPMESSPCIWGALGVATENIPNVGIIPMYMGSTQVFSSKIASYQNHPHVYGEHRYSINILT